MCTVTYIPVKDAVFLTSNRDEKHWRSPARPPAVYPFSTGSILFPRDGDAGGTWIALHENGNAVIFLNGAFEAHEPAPPYRKSRGLILLDLIDQQQPSEGFEDMDLENIEPFTAVVLHKGGLFEHRWDGKKKYSLALDGQTPHIWSSATLYGPVISEKRSRWFDSWLQQHPLPGQEDILNFHQFTGDGDAHNDLLMNRDGQVFTVSVTSIKLSGDEYSMNYLDVRNGLHFRESLINNESLANKTV